MFFCYACGVALISLKVANTRQVCRFLANFSRLATPRVEKDQNACFFFCGSLYSPNTLKQGNLCKNIFHPIKQSGNAGILPVRATTPRGGKQAATQLGFEVLALFLARKHSTHKISLRPPRKVAALCNPLGWANIICPYRLQNGPRPRRPLPQKAEFPAACQTLFPTPAARLCFF